MQFSPRRKLVTLRAAVGFKCEPFSRRNDKSSLAGTAIFAYDGDNLIEETNSSGTAVARYSQGLNIDEPLAMLRGSATNFYQADGLGSITSLTSGSGSIAQSYTFDSFGNVTGSSGSLTNPFQYTAREFDPETSLYYYRARYYDSSAGRFLSEDPIGFRGGSNFYAYVNANATNLSDPTGLKFDVVGDWMSFWDAIRYLIRDPGMAKIIKKLADDEAVYTITTNSHGIDNASIFGDVNWDPHSGIECDGDLGANISPALALGHELGHLSHPWYHRIRDSLPTFDNWDNTEEQITIQQIENPAARTLGEGVRSDHQGKKVRVKSDRTVPSSCDCNRSGQSGKTAPKEPL